MSATVSTKILVVADGYTSAGFSLASQRDTTNCRFTITQFLYLLRNTPQASISIDTASRNADPGAQIQNFTFSVQSLARYSAIWLFAYEGLDDYQTSPTPGSAKLTDTERLAVFNFMNRGGGVFAGGDHSGLGSFMCGNLPRVRSMRKWFGRLADCPTDRQTAHNFAGSVTGMVNWSGVSGSPNSGLPRLDTLRQNPSDTANAFDFDNQSDNIPQILSMVAPLHPIMLGPNGFVDRFPDHMHEGEVVVPSGNVQMTIGSSTFAEFPPVVATGNYPMPRVIATSVTVPNHTVVINARDSKVNCAFTGDPTPSTNTPAGTVCVYDGWPASVGRIVTDASFHHYIDLNLLGNTLAATLDRQSGYGTPYKPPAAGGVMADLQVYYANTVLWLAMPVRGIAASNQFGLGAQTDVFAVNNDGNLAVSWGDGVTRWNGPSLLESTANFVPGGCLTVAPRAATPNQTDVFAIDVSGVIQIFSVVGSGTWLHTATIGTSGMFVPGAPVAVSPRFGVSGQTDLFAVDASGTLQHSSAGAAGWQPFQQIYSPQFFYPGAPVVASSRFGVAGQTDVFSVNAFGIYVSSAEAAQAWSSPIRTASGTLPPLAPFAVSNQFGIPNQTDVFVVDANGTLTVYWVLGNGAWAGPLAIGAAGRFPPGARIAASNQFGIPNQTDVFAIDNTGALTVSWVVAAGKWSGPNNISQPGVFQPGAAVTACAQAGQPNQTNVLAIDKAGAILFFKVVGTANWIAEGSI